MPSWMPNLLCAFAVAVALPSPAAALTLINNGSAPPDPANVIDDLLGDAVLVRNVGCTSTTACASPGAPTTVEVRDGSADLSLSVFDTSTLIASGGTHFTMQGRNDSTIQWNGAVFYDYVRVWDQSRITFESGFARTLSAYGSAHIDMSGGSLGPLGDEGLVLSQSATGTFTGGSTGVAAATGNSVLDFDGGSAGQVYVFQDGRVRIRGGTAVSLLGNGNGVIEVHGQGFAIDGNPVGPGDYSDIGFALLSGVLASGETWLDVELQFAPTAVLRLVPEPMPGLLMGLGVAVAFRRRS